MLQIYIYSISMLISAQITPLSYQVVQTDEARFVATATSIDNVGPYILSIVCEEGCDGDVKLLEQTGDTPLGLFRLSDAEDTLISTWVGGSAYAVRVYRLDNLSISKVLDIHSMASPEISTNASGRTRITVQLREGEVGEPARQTWDWNGNEFIRTGP